MIIQTKLDSLLFSLLGSDFLNLRNKMCLLLELAWQRFTLAWMVQQENKGNAFRLGLCIIVCVIIQQAQRKAHFTLCALWRMTHIHTWLKKETFSFPAVPLCHLSGGSDHFWSHSCFFLYSIWEMSRAVSFHFFLVMNTFSESNAISFSR